ERHVSSRNHSPARTGPRLGSVGVAGWNSRSRREQGSTRWSQIAGECTLALPGPSTAGAACARAPPPVAELFPGISVIDDGREVTRMAARSRIESLTWGLFVTFLGIVFLIGNFRPELRIWANIWKLWPVVLIIAGLNILSRYYASRSSSGSQPPP